MRSCRAAESNPFCREGVAIGAMISAGAENYVESSGVVSGATVPRLPGNRRWRLRRPDHRFERRLPDRRRGRAPQAASSNCPAGTNTSNSGALVSGAQISGYQEIDQGGMAMAVTVASGATEAAFSASVRGITVDQGGNQYLFSGSVASGGIISGYQQVAAGATAEFLRHRQRRRGKPAGRRGERRDRLGRAGSSMSAPARPSAAARSRAFSW